MQQKILGKKVLVVTAHPDDEAFLAAGFLLQNKALGGENYLICGSRGEKGKSHLEKEYSEEELKAVRVFEAKKVLEKLSISHCKFLEYPDGGLPENLSGLCTDVEEFVSSLHVELILSFGDDGFTGHQDHRTAFLAANFVSEKYNVPLLTFALPPQPFGEEYIEHLCKKRSHDKYHTHERFVQPDIELEIDGNAKLEILQLYETQWKGLNPHNICPPHLTEHFLKYEYFRWGG